MALRDEAPACSPKKGKQSNSRSQRPQPEPSTMPGRASHCSLHLGVIVSFAIFSSTTAQCSSPVSGIPGLVGYWPLAVDTTDSSEYGNNMENGGVTFETTDSGAPFSDGYGNFQNDWARITNFDPQAAVGEQTVEFWTKLTADNGLSWWWHWSYTGNDNYWWISAGYNSRHDCDFGTWGRFVGPSVDTCRMDGDWHHIAFTSETTGSSGTHKFYYDGVLIHTWVDNLIPLPPGGVLVLGQEQDCPGGCFDPSQAHYGYMTEVRWWNYARTEAEIVGAKDTRLCNLVIADPLVCDDADRAGCSPYSSCNKTSGTAVCTCHEGFEGDGASCTNIDECLIESEVAWCHTLAYCDNTMGSYECTCPEGFLGDGFTCQSESYGIRSVFQFDDITAINLERLKLAYARAVVSDMADGFVNITNQSAIVETAHVEAHSIGNSLTINVLFADQPTATQKLSEMDPSLDWSGVLAPFGFDSVVDSPAVYRWMGKSTSDPIEIGPNGFTLDSIHFSSDCLNSGCWVVDVTYTTGTNDFNVFYLPEAVGSDSLSYDFDYTTPDTTWTTQSPADTFDPKTHPCTTADYDANDGLLAQVSSCCLSQFFDMYRPTASFVTDVAGDFGSNCGVGARDRPLTSADVRTFAPEDLSGDASAPTGVYVEGLFSGLAFSNGVSAGVVDPYAGIYKARFFLDETELRTTAGRLRGTVGVEHTVDTFLGLLNLSPTGTYVLDTFATQVAIHLEKTSFFSVSTHGTNDYTFLEYVNLRLVAVYKQDADFSGTAESADRTVRTDSTDQANYIQVTFTLGSQYSADPAGVSGSYPLIPLNSVRAGKGTFFNDASTRLDQMCTIYAGASDPNTGTTKSELYNTPNGASDGRTFDSLLSQPDCAPAASMCTVPTSIPDSFVAFNIPLGIDYFPAPSDTLSNNIFVDMVIQALEPGASSDPNSGTDPTQMKTTLTASIPVVEGGINIFCDGFTAKTDLKDVANVDIVVGSAATDDELTRLRIMKNVASTQMDSNAVTQIDSDSIEAGLMTIVLKGNESYFANNAGRSSVTLELEDVITIHIMEDDGDGSDTSASASVLTLLNTPGGDNSDTSGLDTDGYYLNGAFKFTIDRSAQRAHLEPTAELLAQTPCAFNPPRPSAGASPLETCVIRRDVRFRDFPWRTGAYSTATEVCAGGSCPSADTSSESAFFTTIFRDSQYARDLALAYAGVINREYELTDKPNFRRAYWINPGYEWTPTQTGGVPLFSVSQKLFLFALVTLDEGLATGDDGKSITDSAGIAATSELPDLTRRRRSQRRALLQASPSNPQEALQDGQASVAGSVFEFQTSPAQLMAKAFEVPIDRVATFDLQLQLTQAEACLSDSELQGAIRSTLDTYLKAVASAFHTVQVTRLSVAKNGVACRRSLRHLLAALSDATADVRMLVVFEEGQNAKIDLKRLGQMAGVNSVQVDSVSPKVDADPEGGYAPPPSEHEETGSGSDSSSSNVAVVAGAAAGGAVALIVIGIAVVILMRKRSGADRDVVHAVPAIDAQDLKQQLAADC